MPEILMYLVTRSRQKKYNNLQLRGPAENGMYLKGFASLVVISSRKRSGWNFSGSGKSLGLWPIV